MKHYTRKLLLLLLMSITQNIIGLNEFHFSLEDTPDKVFALHDDFLSEDAIAYDATCDRVVLKKPSFIKRACIKLYSLWYFYSEHAKHYVAKYYTRLKNYTYAWYLYVYNYKNRMKK